MGIDITSFYLYRWRYYIGYGLISLVLVAVLVFAGLFEPGGISDAEKANVIKSAGIHITDMSSMAVTNLPFHALQQASLSLFGISDFTIKLPSLILAFISAVGLFLLLKMWFKRNIAILTTLLAISTGQFLYIAQSGTPSILYVLWPIWLIVLGTMIARRIGPRLILTILFFAVSALSLYTPLSIYALVALLAATILHPHLRFVVRGISRTHLFIGAAVALVIISPLIIGIIHTPQLGLDILGIPSALPDFIANINLLAAQYFGFWIGSNTSLMTPVFGLGTLIIIGLGVERVLRTRESTQSYLIIIWITCLIPILIVNPLYTSVTFLPFVLLLAMGLGSLLSYWYRLFPRNPYARIGGLIPLTILIAALALSGFDRYVYGYQYDPKTAVNFSQDLSLLPKNTHELVVSESEVPFYQTVARYHTGMSVVSRPSAASFVATHAAHQVFLTYEIDHIVTSSSTNNSDRYYIYKKSL
jgi:hypothetical protein